VRHVDNSPVYQPVWACLWITPVDSQQRGRACRAPSQCPICTVCLCDVTNMRHAVLGLDFWGYLCYNSIIQKNKEADSMSLANNPQQEDEPSK